MSPDETTAAALQAKAAEVRKAVVEMIAAAGSGHPGGGLSAVEIMTTLYFHVLRVAVIAYTRGTAPILSVEFARRAIPHEVRPSFKEMEGACRGAAAAS